MDVVDCGGREDDDLCSGFIVRRMGSPEEDVACWKLSGAESQMAVCGRGGLKMVSACGV